MRETFERRAACLLAYVRARRHSLNGIFELVCNHFSTFYWLENYESVWTSIYKIGILSHCWPSFGEMIIVHSVRMGFTYKAYCSGRPRSSGNLCYLSR